MGQVSYGTITITDTNDINRIYVEYCRSTSNQLSGTTVPDITRAWGETTPEWVDGQYIWQRTVIEKSGTLAKTYGTPVCLTGAQGETGEQGPQGPQGGTGAAGRSLTGTETKYTNVASNTTQAQVEALAESNWISNVPSYNSSKPDYWVRIKNTYDKAPLTEYIYYKDNGITDAVKTSNDANATATAANQTANQANQTANQANQTANQTQTNLDNYMSSNDANITALQSRLKKIWINENTSGDYVAGTYAASGIDGINFSESNPQTYGYNTLLRQNKLALRYNTIDMTALTTNALTFYVPTKNSNNQWIQGPTGMTLTSEGLKIYNPNSTNNVALMQLNGQNIDFLNLNGDVQAKFGQYGAYIPTLESQEISVGDLENNKYWRLDNSFTDITDREYITLVGIDNSANEGEGNAFIQPSNTGYWRIGRNRIHTGWYNPLASSNATRINYKNFSGTYYDSGIKVPSSLTDKTFYIRHATSSNVNTQSANSDTNWTYKFYIDGNGNLTTTGSIDAHSISIDGVSIAGGSLIAGSLSSYGGNSTQPVYFPSSGDNKGKPVAIGYTIQSSVPENAVFTDTKNTAGAGNTSATKLFLIGATAQNANPQTYSYQKVYATYDGTNAKLFSNDKEVVNLSDTQALTNKTYNGYTLAAASAKGVDTTMPTTATDSNVPTTKLMKSFVEGKGYLTSYTETDPTVPSWAKATSKPSYALSEITGADDVKAIEALTGTSGFLKKTAANTWTLDTNTYLTSYTETDPVFKASAAYGISSADISNWNSKTSNTGTVTSVAASGSGGITISGSPITTSGTITVGLNLSTAINGLGEGTSNANRNDYIVAQYASGGTTTTTYHRRSLAHIFAALNSSDITTALGYTPYNSTNPNGYITANHTSTYSLPVAKYNTLGGVKPAYSSTGAVSLTTAAATNTTTPTIAAKTTTSGRYYAVEIDKNGVLFVNVPWTNVNSSYLTSSSTLNWNNITQNKPTTANGYGITDAITNVSATSASGGSTTFTLTKSNGTTSSFDVVVYASAASQATDANYLTDGTTRYSVGSAKKPIYFDGGIPKASDGTEGTSTKPVYLSSGTITAGSTYAGGTKVTLNNSDKGASTASFYAPTSGGASTQVLIGNGTTSAPVWTNITSLVPTNAGTADAFSSAATVALTGDTTGSASSTKGWSITTKTDRISTVGDNRAAATTPNDYVNKIIFQGLKTNSSFGSPSTDSYSYVIGLRGWSDNSGGNAHEFAFNNSGINHRVGATTSWGAWEKLVTSANYTDYTVTKTGTGASGTWGINISGNAANVTGTVAIANGGTGATTAASARANLGTWSLVSDSYNTLMPADGSTNGWIKIGTSNTSYGLLPSTSGGAGSGHNYIGTSSWYWKYAYIDQIYGYLNGNISGSASSATNAYNLLAYSSNETTIGANSATAGASTNDSVWFNYRDVYGGSVSNNATQITAYHFGNRKGNTNGVTVYAATFSGALSGNASTATKWASAQTVYVTLGTASTTTTIQGGSSSAQTIGVNGTLGVGNGGTGATSFTSGALLIGNGSNAIGTRTIKNMTAKGNLGWTAAATDIYIPTVNTLAYWDGAYSGTSSNLTYCVKGAFGDAAIKGVVTTIDTSANLPTSGAVKTYIDNTVGNYVTIATDQTITANQKTFTGAIRWGNASKYGAAHYDSTLEAIVFSFA